VIGNGPEIETRTIAREIAGVGDRMGALAAVHRQRPKEGVGRIGRVDVQIAEQNDAILAARIRWGREACSEHISRHRRSIWRSGCQFFAEKTAPCADEENAAGRDQRDEDERDADEDAPHEIPPGFRRPSECGRSRASLHEDLNFARGQSNRASPSAIVGSTWTSRGESGRVRRRPARLVARDSAT